MGEREHYVPPDRLLPSDSGDGSSRSLSLSPPLPRTASHRSSMTLSRIAPKFNETLRVYYDLLYFYSIIFFKIYCQQFRSVLKNAKTFISATCCCWSCRAFPAARVACRTADSITNI